MKTILLIVALATTSSIFAAEYEGDAKKHIKDDVLTCPYTGIKFKSPDLNTKKLRVAVREVTPNITWQLMFAEELNHLAVVTYTKIRKEYPKTDQILGRTASNMKMEGMRDGGYLEWAGFLSDKEGKVLQCVIRYPRAGQPAKIRNEWLDRMETIRLDVYEIRHYLVRGGYMIEFKYYIPQFLPKGTFSEEKLIDLWSPRLSKFVAGCSLLGEKDNYVTQVKEFKRPKTYFRFVFKDPSREKAGAKKNGK